MNSAPATQIHLDWTCSVLTVFVTMKRTPLASAVVLFATLLTLGAGTARAQVVPSATRGHLSLTVGGLASAFQPDYACCAVAATAPNRLYGVGAFVDVRFTRWVQVEGEGRWLRFNELDGINEDNYLIGPRLPIHHFRLLGATPYAKVLAGLGRMNFEGSEAWGRYAALAYGAGVDFRLTKRFSARGDFEYQQWPSWPNIPGVANTALFPYGASVGIGYKVF
jgi:Outer membrane protein beta-barrel domain